MVCRKSRKRCPTGHRSVTTAVQPYGAVMTHAASPVARAAAAVLRDLGAPVGRLHVSGTAPVLPSCFAVDLAAAAVVGAAGLAAAALWQVRGGAAGPAARARFGGRRPRGGARQPRAPPVRVRRRTVPPRQR